MIEREGLNSFLLDMWASLFILFSLGGGAVWTERKKPNVCSDSGKAPNRHLHRFKIIKYHKIKHIAFEILANPGKRGGKRNVTCCCYCFLTVVCHLDLFW